MVTGGGLDCVDIEAFKWINTIIGNIKSSIHGAYHSINPKHLPRYLAEVCYRFNRRFELGELLSQLMYAPLKRLPMPCRPINIVEAHG